MHAHHNSSSLSRVLTSLLALGAALAAPAAHAGNNANVGVSISIDQPGFYGRINIGDQPPPLIYQQPMIIQQTPVAVYQRPIYLHVPPGHYKRWAQYCGRYRACGQPVYFVQDGWARQHYGRPGWGGPGGGPREDRGEWHERGRDHEEHGRGHGHDREQGHGRGRGH
jgi:hypothetical protein